MSLWRRNGSKYHAQPTVVDGMRFASKAEARRYGELLLLGDSGSIRNLEIQPRFPLKAVLLRNRIALSSGGTNIGRPSSAPIVVAVGEYRADFAYEELTETGGRWDFTVEDVKGVKTPLYRWKKKHFEAQYGIQIREIR